MTSKLAHTQGLLLYMVDRTELFYVSLSMLDGALHLYAHPDNEVVTKDLAGRYNRYNDNTWHVVSVFIGRMTSGENVIRLHLDDNYVAAPHQVANIPLVAAGSEYDLWVGGLPDRLRPLRAGVAAHEGPWTGCLKDAIVLANYLNFQVRVVVIENLPLFISIWSKFRTSGVDTDPQGSGPLCRIRIRNLRFSIWIRNSTLSFSENIPITSSLIINTGTGTVRKIQALTRSLKSCLWRQIKY
jgi:hypothetical protein